MMKQILKEWRKFLTEARGFGEGEPPDDTTWYKKRTIVVEDEDNLEQNIYSFDYDETLIRHKPDPEDPEFSITYDGLHEENIAKLRELAAAGHTVLIVTSRSKRTGDKHPWDSAPDPEELVAELELPVESIHYTHGDLKAETLLSLGVVEHWDDDEEEVAAAEAAGIKANLVPSALEEGAIAKWWANKLDEAGFEVAPRMQKYLKDRPYMEPDGLQETN